MRKYEVIEFREGRNGRPVGRRANRDKGPIALLDRRAQGVELYVPVLCEVYYPDGKYVCYALPLDVESVPVVAVTYEWLTFRSWKFGCVGQAVGGHKPVYLVNDGGFDTDPPGEEVPVMVRWVADGSVGLAQVLGNPWRDVRDLLNALNKAESDLRWRACQARDSYVAMARRKAESEGLLVYGEVEVYPDYHPFADDYAPYAPPLPPNSRKYKHRYVEQGKDVLENIEAEGHRLAEAVRAESVEDVARIKALREAIYARFAEFVAAWPGLSYPRGIGNEQ